MASSGRERSPRREIHGSLASDYAQGVAIDAPEVPKSLLFAVHATQIALAGVFCLICLWAYRGTLPPPLEQWWIAWLVSLAVAWVAALPLFAWLWRFTPPIDARLPFWASYWIGLLALPVLIVGVVISALRRLSRGLVERSRARLSLLAGAVTLWPIMQLAAYLACREALPMTLAEERSLSPY